MPIMRFLLQFEYLVGTEITIIALDSRSHTISRIFECGDTENWRTAYQEMLIDHSGKTVPELEQAINEGALNLLRDYANFGIRNLVVWGAIYPLSDEVLLALNLRPTR